MRRILGRALVPLVAVVALTALPTAAQATSYVKWGAGPNPTTPLAAGTYNTAGVGQWHASLSSGALVVTCNVYSGATITNPASGSNGPGTGSVKGFWQNGEEYPATPCTVGGSLGTGCTAGFTAETITSPTGFTTTLPWAMTLGISGSTLTNTISSPAWALTFHGSCLLGGVTYKVTTPAPGTWTTNLTNNVAPVEHASKECSGTPPNSLTETLSNVVMKTDSGGELSVTGTIQLWKVGGFVTKFSAAQACSSLGVLNTTL